MGRGDLTDDAAGDGDEQPEHDATVAAFVLDRFEVTVGRFRRFVAAFDGTPPVANAGAHPLIEGSGWRPEWDASLPSDRPTLVASLKCDPSLRTWTDQEAELEDAPPLDARVGALRSVSMCSLANNDVALLVLDLRYEL